MLANNPTNIDIEPTGLDYWVRRATDKSARGEKHYTYQGARLVVHPQRAAMISFEGHTIMVQDDDSYKGRGWFDRFLSDIEDAVARIKAGEGDVPQPSAGDRIREEIKLRKAGEKPEPTEWWQYLNDEELPLLLGCWLFRSGVMSMKYEISRNAKLDFHPTNDEFNLGAQSTHHHVLWATFQRRHEHGRKRAHRNQRRVPPDRRDGRAIPGAVGEPLIKEAIEERNVAVRKAKEHGSPPFYDLPFEQLCPEDTARLIELMPGHLKGLLDQWGWGDTVLRDSLFEWVLRKVWDIAPDQFYTKDDEDRFKFEPLRDLIEDGKRIKLDLRLLEKKR